MKNTNIVLDAGVTAFVETINDKLARQTRTCKWLTVGLIICGIYTFLSVKRIKKLETEINEPENVEF